MTYGQTLLALVIISALFGAGVAALFLQPRQRPQRRPLPQPRRAAPAYRPPAKPQAQRRPSPPPHWIGKNLRFVARLLDRCLRLSYYERIESVLRKEDAAVLPALKAYLEATQQPVPPELASRAAAAAGVDEGGGRWQ